MTEVSSEPGTSHSLIHSSAFNTFFPRNKWDLFLGTQTYKFSSIKRVMRRKLGSSCTLHFPFSGSVCFSTSRSKGVLPFTDPRSWPGKFSCVSPAVFLLPILISILRTTLSCLKSSITFQSASRPSSTLICWNLLLARLRVAGLWAPSSAYQLLNFHFRYMLRYLIPQTSIRNRCRSSSYSCTQHVMAFAVPSFLRYVSKVLVQIPQLVHLGRIGYS